MAEPEKPTVAEIIRSRLIESRERLGWTQSQLAKSAGISERTYTTWEQGGNAPKVEALIQLATALGVSLDYLTGRVDEFEAHTCLDRGAILIDERNAARILSAGTAAELDPVVVNPQIFWAYQVPQKFSIVDMDEYARRKVAIDAAFEPLRAATLKRWRKSPAAHKSRATLGLWEDEDQPA